MARSVFAENLDLVQTPITGLLRPLGFRKTGRTYNCTSPEGLVQVISLQIARPEPVPPQRRVAGELAAPSDRFAVNLGVWVPEVSDYHLTHPRSKAVQEYDCHVRARLSDLMTTAGDLWWPLDHRWPDAAATVVQLLQELGLPWLERFGTRDGIVGGWVDQAPDARIVRAIIQARRGDRDQARLLLGEQFASTRQPTHRAYVQMLARQLGFDVLSTA